MARFDDFTRHVNFDHTIESTCLKCLRVVATNRDELELLIAEEGHLCDPLEKNYLDSQRGTF